MSGDAWWTIGNSVEVLRDLPASSVDMVMTSPPFMGLRSYLADDDPAKPDEIGHEGSPGGFVDALLDLTEELRRVLAPHGSICVELGDSYSGSGGPGGDYNEGGFRDSQPPPPGNWQHAGTDGWPLAKSACLVPEAYRFALAYGRNPHNGRATPQWLVRNTVRWVRPNPPVGALGDKFRPATSDMVVACTSPQRYFDLDAVRTPLRRPPKEHSGGRPGMEPSKYQVSGGSRGGPENAGGTPPLDWWHITPAAYPGAHHAVYPPQLCEVPIQSMCPAKVCTVCGEPSRRLVEVDGLRGVDFSGPDRDDRGAGLSAKREPMPDITRTTVGWTDCGHDAWRAGRVLDPFGGSGTTLAVATGHGRDAVGIDLDQRNTTLAQERVGPLWFYELSTSELAERLAV